MPTTLVKPPAWRAISRLDSPTIAANIGEQLSSPVISTTISAISGLLFRTTIPGSTREPRSQTTDPTVRLRHHRRLSVGLHSAALIPLRRPSQYGTMGKPIEIYTNHFRISIDDIGNIIVNQYEIEIRRIRRDGKRYGTRGNKRWDVVRQYAKENPDFPIFCYDNDKFLYTRKSLPDLKTASVTITNNNGKTAKFEFQLLDLVRQVKVQNIDDFINGRTLMPPRESIQMVNSFLKQDLRSDYVCAGNKFYRRTQQLKDIGEGRGIASGFHQAFCLTGCGPTLNLNLAFACFYLPLNFVEFACKCIGKDITRCKTADQLEGIKPVLRNLLVETTHTGRPIQYRVRGFGQPAEELRFEVSYTDTMTAASTTETITVAEYFAKKYKPLRYPHLLCVNATKGTGKQSHWLPMEVVKIVEWERAFNPVNNAEPSVSSRITIVKPDRRYGEIMDIARRRNFNSDPFLKALNIQVDTREMLKISARILPPPTIKYCRRDTSELVEQVSVGKWTIHNRFFATTTINRWGLLYFGPKLDLRMKNILNGFICQLVSLLANYGIRINSQLERIARTDVTEDIERAMTEAKGQCWEFAIVVLNNTRPSAYEDVKRWGNQRLGLVTQCVNFQSVERNLSALHPYIHNLSQKINAKLGGVNGFVNLKAVLSQPSNEDLFMFFGAHINRTVSSTSQPSLTAVVGSCDPTGSRYAARLCEQYPKAGRCSVEVIQDLDKMVTDLLQVFARTCGQRLPNKIVFYRENIDDDHLQKILDNEVNKINEACRNAYINKPLPKLTFITVNKRHNTRFFAYDSQSIANVVAGTVIDRDLTSPSQFDFYLCSHDALLGTSCPAHYHVLHDDIGFGSDDIQQLTYWLCYIDARCTRSVSIPTPVHYARLAANAARAYDFDDNRKQHGDDDDIDELENVSLEDLQTRVMILNDKIQDQMWFV